MLLLQIVPLALLCLAFQLFPIVILFGISAPGYGAALLYRKVFAKIEPHEEAVTPDMEFRLATDEEDSQKENP